MASRYLKIKNVTCSCINTNPQSIIMSTGIKETSKDIMVHVTSYCQ